MSTHAIHDVVVASPEGWRIITTQTVMGLRLAEVDFNMPLSEASLPRVPFAHPDQPIADGLAALRESPTEHLCLVDSWGQLAGIVSFTDILAHLDPKHLAQTRRIRDFIKLSDFCMLSTGDTLQAAMLKMHTAGHSAALARLPSAEVGIITRSDITNALSSGQDWHQPVTAFMTAPAFTVSEDLTLQQALATCREKHLKRLIVTDANKKVVGLLHQKDLVTMAYESWQQVVRPQSSLQREVASTAEQEQRWRAVLEGTQQGVWDWNAKTNQVYFSPTWKAMLGYAEDEIGDSLDEWDSRLHPDDRAAVYADLERHFTGQAPIYENTHRVRCKDGHYKWILDRGKVFSTDAAGRPLRVVGTHTDVTDDYEQKRQLNRLAENVPGMLYQYRLFSDGRSCFPFATKNIWDVYGVTPKQVADDASEVLQRLHPDDASVVADSIAVSAQNLSVWEIQYRYNHPVKGECWLEGRATPEKMLDGSVTWNGYIYDITERKRQELALEEATMRYQLTMEATGTGLWEWDLKTDNLRWSPQTYEQLGYPANSFAVCLQQFQQMVHPDDLQPLMQDVMRSIEEDDSFTVQYRMRHAQGHWLWIQGRGKVTMRDAEGAPVYVMGTHSNISTLKQVERELAEAKAAADEASQAKSQFLANMSHEIRTPMSGIIGLSQISLDEHDVGVLHDRLKKIHQSGRMLLGILNDILDFSKIEAGKLEVDPQPFLLRVLLNNLESLFADMATVKGLVLTLSADESLEDAYIGDELRIRQILTNLIGNAIKFTERGRVQLHVSVAGTAGRPELAFSVQDTGIGISEAQQAQLFTAFNQGDASITREFGGSGLGLIISERLVEALGGTGIQVASNPGQGSCFSFSIPMVRCQLAQVQELMHGESAALDQYPGGIQGRVLLVEDNMINQEVAKHLLQKIGLMVEVAGNGKEAIDCHAKGDIDLILMDIQMPVMDGYEATRQLRASGCRLPIIALTAAAMVEDQNKAFAAGMNGHLAKPIDLQALLQVLLHWLPGAQVPAAPVQRSNDPGSVNHHQSPEAAVESRSAVNPSAEPPAAETLVNTKMGLALLNGNVALYQKLLQTFLDQLDSDYADLPQQIRVLDNSSSRDAFHSVQQQTHGLKGVAGNLALGLLAQEVAALDTRLKQARVPEAGLIEAFELRLKQTAAAVRAWVEAQGSNTATALSAADNDELQAVLSAIRDAIENSEFIDVTELQRHSVQVPASLRNDWQALCLALDYFDYDQAKRRLEPLFETLSEGETARAE
jgi:PAS domain S-box-containing protein